MTAPSPGPRTCEWAQLVLAVRSLSPGSICCARAAAGWPAEATCRREGGWLQHTNFMSAWSSCGACKTLAGADGGDLHGRGTSAEPNRHTSRLTCHGAHRQSAAWCHVWECGMRARRARHSEQGLKACSRAPEGHSFKRSREGCQGHRNVPSHSRNICFAKFFTGTCYTLRVTVLHRRACQAS